MRNLKINTKLILSFGVVLVLMFALGIISLFNIRNVNDIVNLYKRYSLPNTRYALSIEKDLIMMREHLLTALIDTDQNVINDNLARVTQKRSDVDKVITEYKKSIRADVNLLNDVVNTINDCAPIRERITNLAKENRAETNAQAYEIFIKEYKPKFDSAIEKLDKLVSLQNDLAKAQDTHASEVSLAANVNVIVFLLLSLILTFSIIILLKKLIVVPIIRIEKASHEIVNGNLNINLKTDGKDEVGQLESSFSKLKDTILLLTNDLSNLSKELNKGDIDARIDTNKFKGEYKIVAEAINSMIQDLVNDTLAILGAYSQLGDGNFKAELVKMPGKKAIVNEQFDVLKGNFVTLNNDVQSLIKGAIDGKLDTRVNENAYKGDWKQLIHDLNLLLQAISIPIDDANKVLAEISNGNFKVSVSTDYKGSFGVMMNSFSKMVASTASYINEITEVLGTIADGDLRKNISREYIGQYALIKDSINNITSKLRTTLSEIQASAENVLSGSKLISESSMDLASGASTQASSVQELNASIDMITDQTQKTADKTQSAKTFSMQSIENAKIGNDEMQKMLASMSDIKDASKDISKIIKVIDDIAFQTNLLALNAAVEAARAGENGKGFAVVAEEVRSLAGRTLQSAKDTSAMIEDIILKIGEGTENAQQTAQFLQKIVSDTASISDIITDVDIATASERDSIMQISVGINQISEVVQRNSATSEESAAAAQELNSQSEMLAQMVSNFKI